MEKDDIALWKNFVKQNNLLKKSLKNITKTLFLHIYACGLVTKLNSFPIDLVEMIRTTAQKRRG